MKWKQFRLKTTTQAEDIVSSMLADLGIEGVQIEDKIPLTEQDKEQMFVDILPDIPDDDGTAYLTFYLDEEEDVAPVLMNVRKELEDMRAFLDVGECTIEESETEDVDWVNNWKQYFHQFYIDDILVIPSWENVKPEDSDKMVIHIDPGTAFGTGMHETTQLCMRQLKKYVTSETELLDVGTGSGILSIIAARLGASRVLGIDIDDEAVTASEENGERNGVMDIARFQIGDLTEGVDFQADVVVANLLTHLVLRLSPDIPKHMLPGGRYVTSGILVEQEASVVQALEELGFTVLETAEKGDWCCIASRL